MKQVTALLSKNLLPALMKFLWKLALMANSTETAASPRLITLAQKSKLLIWNHWGYMKKFLTSASQKSVSLIGKSTCYSFKPYKNYLMLVFARYAGRYDCGCVYECRFSLLNKKKEPLINHEFRQSIKQWEGREWHKVKVSFKNRTSGFIFDFVLRRSRILLRTIPMA